jgi:hypothetical protein
VYNLQGKLIMSLTYGYDLKEGDNIIVAPVQVGETMSLLIMLPAATLVNNLPFCAVTFFTMTMLPAQSFSVKYIPSWVPWLSYEPLAQRINLNKKLSEQMRNDPLNFVKNATVLYHCVPRIHTDRQYTSMRELQGGHWQLATGGDREFGWSTTSQ